MKRFLLFTLALVVQTSIGALPRQGAQAPPARATHPNILFILADDLGAESSSL